MESADKTEIENLMFRYARYVDTADYAALGELFRHGQVTANQGTAPLVGSEVIRNFYATTNRTHSDGTARTHHIVTNFEFEPERGGDRVRVRSCFTVFQGTDRLPLQPIVCGRYQDLFGRIDGAWHFLVKHIEVTLIGQLREHLNIELK